MTHGTEWLLVLHSNPNTVLCLSEEGRVLTSSGCFSQVKTKLKIWAKKKIFLKLNANGKCDKYILKMSESAGISDTNQLVFHRYYDHKRHAAKKTQKTVEAAEKVFFLCF